MDMQFILADEKKKTTYNFNSLLMFYRNNSAGGESGGVGYIFEALLRKYNQPPSFLPQG
jgi:hypothetical protein